MVTLFSLTRGPWGELAAWPDGGPLLNQPVKLVEAFGVIASVKARYTKKPGGK